ncbi:MAG: ParA family protein [Verrucomicrobiota bacterium]
MPRRISFINCKGGVGKTSLVVNVAAYLAQAGKRVLLIDLDAQSNSSIWLLRMERWNSLLKHDKGHLYSIFKPDKNRLGDCIIPDVVRGEEGDPVLPGLDLVPSTYNLVDLEEADETEEEEPAYAFFQNQLSEIEDDYDYIFFDCPPNLLRASSCGIFCCNEIYTPSNPDALSLIGFCLLADKVEQFQKESLEYRLRKMGPPAEIRGAIFNSIGANVDISGPKMRMQFRMNQIKGKGPVAEDVHILETIVRDAVIVPRSVTLGLPVCAIPLEVDEDTVRDDYRRLATEIMEIPLRREQERVEARAS